MRLSENVWFGAVEKSASKLSITNNRDAASILSFMSSMDNKKGPFSGPDQLYQSSCSKKIYYPPEIIRKKRKPGLCRCFNLAFG